jgi:hypothetical protein
MSKTLAASQQSLDTFIFHSVTLATANLSKIAMQESSIILTAKVLSALTMPLYKQ